MKVKAKVTHTFNDFGDGGVTYLKGAIYDAEYLESGSYSVKHPSGGELGFLNDFHDYFVIIRK